MEQAAQPGRDRQQFVQADAPKVAGTPAFQAADRLVRLQGRRPQREAEPSRPAVTATAASPWPVACATVVIPALNEAARIASVVRHALADPATAEVIVIDDSSIDDTALLARQAGAHGVVVEQAEDEISAVNMALGAWYAGGRALVTTSGGGFDLMAEGLSLCGIIESPLVIHLAQRPGPGTGLPTRSEQGDLEIARYSGHGEFPRAILAPGSAEEAFACTAHAFRMADAAQSPVFVLTDQHLLDGVQDLAPLSLRDAPPESQIVATAADYQRYAPGPDGVSPRGIPGWGQGFVRVDSDEHDADGRITEDFTVRTTMVDKRLAKLRLLSEDLALVPRLHGPAEFRRLIVGWGSTGPAVIEALERLRPEDTSYLHCVQLYPLSPALLAYLERAERIIVIEGNATGQFARLLRAECGCAIVAEWHKYNGLAFSADEVETLLRTEVSA